MRRFIATVFVLATALPACGGNQQVFVDLAMPFLGTWQISSGNDTAACVTGPPQPSVAVTGSVIVGVGAPPGTLTVQDTNHGTCLWFLTASETVATFRSGQECTSTAGVNQAAVLPRDYVLTLLTNQDAVVTSKFDWSILDDTCTHIQNESLVHMLGQ